jgi:putative colanic acid biosynthesis UDP-glucose lipid carrier transferase
MKQATAYISQDPAILKKVSISERLPDPGFLYHSASPLDKKANRLLKRSLDLAVSSALLFTVFIILLPVIALLIRLDSKGPIFFLQKRNKKKGLLFSCIKFRTMVVNEFADTLPAYVDDKRITRVGKFLRRYHLDELPQLLNVWWGDMSLVGPRPYMVIENEKFGRQIRHYPLRHQVKPGITGLAQASGLFGCLVGSSEMQDRVALDLTYIHSWSFVLDLRILARTLKIAFRPS